MKIRSLVALLRNTSRTSVKKGEVLIPKGSTNQEVFYVRKGLIRSYYYDETKLEEVTFQIYPEANVVLNLSTILFDEPSKYTYQALENTKLYRINYTALIELTSNNPQFLELNRRFVGKKALQKAMRRVESFVFLSPEERYLQYIQDYPNIVHRVPDKYIAHVLGITPVSLSRIRKRLASKKS